MEPLPQARSKFWMELRWDRILLNITWELDLIEKTLIWICTTVMGPNQSWQSRQLLIRRALFGAPFLAPSQFIRAILSYKSLAAQLPGVLLKWWIVLFRITSTNIPSPCLSASLKLSTPIHPDLYPLLFTHLVTSNVTNTSWT